MGRYYLFVVKAAQGGFLTTEPYDWQMEIAGRDLFAGTKMGLSQFALSLEQKVTTTVTDSIWAKHSFLISSTFQLNRAGKMILARERAHYKQDGEKHVLQGIRIGSVSFWGCRANERRRQIWKLEKAIKEEPGLTIVATIFQEVKEASLDNWQTTIQLIKDELQLIISERNYERVFNNVRKYIVETDKSKSSVIPHSGGGFEYDDILGEDLIKVCEGHDLLLTLIIDNLYSIKRLNTKDNAISAIRHRAEDYTEETMTETSAEGVHERDRGATGTPPFNQIWMLIYDMKKVILIGCLDRLEIVYGIKFQDPIRNPNFYYDFTHFVPGLYLFGDNGLVIKDKNNFICYDISVSDAFQGLMRRDKDGKNLCFFMRLTPILDIGSTGDPFTTIWTIEGQLIIWKAYRENKIGKMPNHDCPYLKGILEESATFLGHYWDPYLRIWRTLGLKVTRDKASEREAVNLISQHLYFQARKKVDEIEFCENLIATGLTYFTLERFYEWVKARTDFRELDYVEGPANRIHEMLKPEELPEFMDHFDRMEIKRLCEPMGMEEFKHEKR